MSLCMLGRDLAPHTCLSPFINLTEDLSCYDSLGSFLEGASDEKDAFLLGSDKTLPLT